MGDWGPGPFENDHAMDLVSIETARWVEALREVLDTPDVSWDDIQGHLGYVHLLALVGAQTGMYGLLTDNTKPAAASLRPAAPESSREVATRWKARFLEIEATMANEPGFKPSAAFTARRKAVTKTFDALIRAVMADDAPNPKPKRGSRKAK